MGQVRPYGSRKRRSDNEPAGAIGATSDGHAQGRQTMTVRKGKITRARLWVALDPSNFMSWNRKKVERWYANSVLNRPPVIGFCQTDEQVPPVEDQRDVARHQTAALEVAGREATPAPLVLQLVEGVLAISTVAIELAARCRARSPERRIPKPRGRRRSRRS